MYNITSQPMVIIMQTRNKDKKKQIKDTTPKFLKKPDESCQSNVQQNVQVDVKIEQADDCLAALFRCLKKAK